jgi:hypothetical protein
MGKIAAICTIYHPLSHADVIVTRWLDPHPRDAEVDFVPQTQIASLYVAQRPACNEAPSAEFVLSPGQRVPAFTNRFDIGQLVAQQYGVPLFTSIREALTLGGDQLAVDGVLLIAEHGDYPSNSYGQKLYPRKEFFDTIVAVFRETGRVVPVFCDKHLSWNADWATEMVQTIRTLGIPFLAGSSISLAGPELHLDLPTELQIEESLGLFYVHPETYGFHSLEFVQSIIERRTGAEQGIRRICAYKGEGVWAAYDQGLWSHELFAAALAAGTTKPGDLRVNCRASGQVPVAFCLEYLDGHRSSHIMLDGHLSDFTLAFKLKGDSRIRAARAKGSTEETFVQTFAVLNREIQQLMLTGQTAIPLERTWLTTLTIASCMQALQQPGQWVETPQLAINYRA